MAIAPGVERVLACGGVLLVDELEKEMHPMLFELIVSKFQSKTSNPNNAQLIFYYAQYRIAQHGIDS